MPIDTTFLASDLGHMIADLPATVTIGIVTGTGALAPVDRAQVLDMTGMGANVDAQLTIAAATFSRPTRNQVVSVTAPGGTLEVFRVVSVQDAADGVAYTLTLTKDTR